MWNDARKIGAYLNSEAESVKRVQALFSPLSFLPYLFSCERKDRAVGDIRQSQVCNNLSVSASPSQHPYPFCPFGTFPPDRGNRPLEGEPLPPTTAVAEMVEVWYYDTITGEKETHYAADIRI